MPKDPRIMKILADMASNARVYGGGSSNGDVLGAGGIITTSVPVTKGLSVEPYVGGGGAFGSVNTPQGKKKIREFSPEGGIGVRYRW